MRRKTIKILAVVLMILVAAGTLGYYFVFTKQDNNLDIADDGFLNNRVSFLLIGADKRPQDPGFNADSIIMASVDPQSKIISMLSIPRDTRVRLSEDNFVKMNSVPMLESTSVLMDKVTELTGVPLQGYIMTNFNGFKSIIDTLGGIDLYVEKDMYYETGDNEDGYINLKQGEQRLNGEQALQYARFRHDALADISRTARQQKVLRAVADQLLQVKTITRLPALIAQFKAAVETNLSLTDLLRMAKAAAAFDSSNIVAQTLPGAFLDYDGISYWEVNPEQTKITVQNLFLGITSDKVIDNEVIDLLDPGIKAHIKVPGNPQDPNSKKSPSYQDFLKNYPLPSATERKND
ncbi:cell envelope-related transcriptional attenuator [Syntrophobotulus glycolicus DSM 8271]|uniref:Cell envelope-related transcriptional attenuator n=1 Tax=Syntrophobotulus glycolicus (strain DSM 8271 / FlGlyR) TaxID=645991 RepID=F0SZX9_SYNGF|nr:LCP family protein [Syntrophobotulus glycolicus]ADY54990.1 cell envelope-related transcriptional attenuator [Syntrophobotulus glycolicus DSM 8271]